MTDYVDEALSMLERRDRRLQELRERTLEHADAEASR